MSKAEPATLSATVGIADYWVLNAVRHVFRDPQPLGGTVAYRDCTTYTASDTVTLLAVPNVPIPVADLLP